jgi:hypothetical protein
VFSQYSIRNCEDKRIIETLSVGMSIDSNDLHFLENYHPKYSHLKSNLFYQLRNGRYESGEYIVITEGQSYVASAGWYERPDYIIALSRAFVIERFRGQQILADKVLPKVLAYADKVSKPVWMTFNNRNLGVYQGFVRANSNKAAALGDDWPTIFRLFAPIGMKFINNTHQYVVEYKKHED